MLNSILVTTWSRRRGPSRRMVSFRRCRPVDIGTLQSGFRPPLRGTYRTTGGITPTSSRPFWGITNITNGWNRVETAILGILIFEPAMLGLVARGNWETGGILASITGRSVALVLVYSSTSRCRPLRFISLVASRGGMFSTGTAIIARGLSVMRLGTITSRGCHSRAVTIPTVFSTMAAIIQQRCSSRV